MLNKIQILKRVESILSHKDIANKRWFVEQLEGLISSANSPEVFE